jgi:hypothetical protein
MEGLANSKPGKHYPGLFFLIKTGKWDKVIV